MKCSVAKVCFVLFSHLKCVFIDDMNVWSEENDATSVFCEVCVCVLQIIALIALTCTIFIRFYTQIPAVFFRHPLIEAD